MGYLEKFRGIYSALLSPIDTEGNVNEEVLRELIDWHLCEGLRGVYVCGSTGQGPVLEDNTRQRIAEIAVEMCKGRGKVIVHCGHIIQERAISLAKHAEKIGADAISSVPPIYYKSGFKAIRQYYQRIAGATGLPFFIYNVPSLVDMGLTPEQFSELLHLENVIGMKYTSYDLFSLSLIMQGADDDMVFLSGADEMFLPALSIGVSGSIGSTQNIVPGEFVNLMEDFQRGSLFQAKERQYRINRLISTLGPFGLAGWLHAAGIMGFNVGSGAPPLLSLSHDEEEKLTAEFKKINL
jgi:N-acetylneuraminate lyase